MFVDGFQLFLSLFAAAMNIGMMLLDELFKQCAQFLNLKWEAEVKKGQSARLRARRGKGKALILRGLNAPPLPFKNLKLAPHLCFM